MNNCIILLHGFATDIEDFSPLMPFLKDKYKYIELTNILGHGKESHLDDFLFDKVIEIIDKMYVNLIDKYDYIDIIGFSMGGALAAYLAGKGKFRKVVLLSPANHYINWKLPATRIKILFDYYSHRKTSLQEIDIDKLRFDDKKSGEIFLKELIPNYSFHALNNFRKLMKYCNENLKPISAQTLIIWGNVDQLVPYSSIEFVSSYCSDVQIEIFDNLSHLMLHSIDNQQLIKKIVDFLN